MVLNRSSPLATAAIRVAFAGLGAAVAGPLGGALGAVIGNALGPSAAELVRNYTERFGEKAAEKLLDTSADSLLEKLKQSAPDLGSAYRQALRLSLSQIRPRMPALSEPEYDDWFTNWDVCLKASVTLSLEEIHASQLAPESLDTLIRHAMERLDAQGKAIQRRNQSLILQTRPIPLRLLAEISNRLPEHFEENFRVLVVQPNYEQAWKQAELVFRDSITAALGRIEERTAILPKMAEGVAAIHRMLEKALNEGRIPDQDSKAKDDEITRLTEELRKLQEQLAVRSSEPAEAELSKLLEAGDLDAALRLKSQQVQTRREESAKLPRDLYELGTIHELRFEWPQALAAYRQAWEMGRVSDLGFKYARMAQRLNRFTDAIATYEAVLAIYTDPEDRAITLNNLANVYFGTGRTRKAEEAYGDALAIYRELADANADAYLWGVAMALNNLANVYRDTNRMQEAEEAYGEALTTYRKLADANADAYLPYVAIALNNLANVYSVTQRIRKAEEAYGEALSIRRKLADADTDAYLPDIALTLNNLANLYRNTNRMQKAEETFGEALASYRKLADANPDAYLPDVANTLNNLGNAYSDNQRRRKAEEAYGEALSIRRKFADANPDAYLPDVASTLNNLGILYGDTQRMQEAEEAYREALSIRRRLADANPDARLPDVAMTLHNLANLYRGTQRMQEAEEAYREALSIRRRFADANADVYLPYVAITLNNLANFYRDNRRMQEADEAYGEALATSRKLAVANPDAHLPNVAITLHNLANFCLDNRRMQEAETHIYEAERILNPRWQENPGHYGDVMARILWTSSLISESHDRPATEPCAFARRALAAAYHPTLRHDIQQLINRLCPKSLDDGIE